MNVIRLYPISEIARRNKKCVMTLRRQVAAANIKPDAVMIHAGREIPLYVEAQAKLLPKKLTAVIV
jgi:hypothetical protein